MYVKLQRVYKNNEYISFLPHPQLAFCWISGVVQQLNICMTSVSMACLCYIRMCGDGDSEKNECRREYLFVCNFTTNFFYIHSTYMPLVNELFSSFVCDAS